MRTKTPSKLALLEEIQQLRDRLQEAESTLDAIRNGEVDALVISGPRGDQIFTLKTADHPYRVLVEAINEGAATLLGDGTILYCNARFAEMLRRPLPEVLGQNLFRFAAP